MVRICSIMALNDVKKQVLCMLQSVLTLDSIEQSEAMGFLQDCVTNFGLSVSKNLHTTSSLNDVRKEVNIVHSDLNNTLTENDGNLTNSNIYKKLPDKGFIHSVIDLEATNKNFSTLKTKEDDNISKGKSKQIQKKNLPKKIAEDYKTIYKETDVKFIEKNEKFDQNLYTSLDENSVKSEKSKLFNENVLEQKDDKLYDYYKCPACLAKYDTKPPFVLHLKSHTEDPMSCRMCKSYFSSVLNYWQHQKNGKCRILELQCIECNEKFKYRRHYLKHILGHKDNNCRYCDEKFSTWANYRNHLKEKHPDIKMERDLIPCKFCSMSFHRHVGLYNHYRVKHSKGKFVCLSCGLLLPTKEKHKEHVQIHESKKNWKCKICKMKFYRRQQLLFHVSIHKMGVYKCLTCDITVTSKTDLYKHKKNGHSVKGLERKFECDICHKTFAKRFTLGNHLATHSMEKSFTCKYCVKSFRTLDSLNRHQKRKSHFEKAKIIIPESKYEKVYEDKLICEKCGKQYKTQRELKCHLIVHKSIYECNECGKTFTLKFNLTKHLKLHRNPEGVVCELCGDTFNQLSALNEHSLMKHSDIRKAKCEICQKAFKRKSELNRHLRIHEVKRPFVCFCGKAYKQSAHLQNHYKSAHGTSKQGTFVGNSVDSFQSGQTSDMYRENVLEKRKKVYVDGGQDPLVPLENLDSEAVFRPSASYIEMQINENQDGKVSYVSNYNVRYSQNDIEPITVNYEDLNFGSSQSDKRGLVFASPAVDMSMVPIPEVVQNEMQINEGHRDVGETVESFNKISDDNSQIQLLNLSEHIVQEYLLNLQ